MLSRGARAGRRVLAQCVALPRRRCLFEAALPTSTSVSHTGISPLVVAAFALPDHHVSGRLATGSVTAMLADGRSRQACALLESHLTQGDPRDFAAAHLLFDVHEFRQETAQMRDVAPRVLWAWSEQDEDDARYSAVLALHARGLVACGDFRQGEDVGMKALLRDPCTPSAIEAVAASLVAQGRNREGKRFIRDMEHCFEGPEGDGVPGSFLSKHTLNITALSAAMDTEQGKHQHVLVHRLINAVLRDVPYHDEFDDTRDGDSNSDVGGGENAAAADDEVAWKHEAAERVRVAVAVAGRLQCALPLHEAEAELADVEGSGGGREPTLFTRMFGGRGADDTDATGAPQLADVWTAALETLRRLEDRAGTFSARLGTGAGAGRRLVCDAPDAARNLSVAPALAFEAHVMLAHAMAGDTAGGAERLRKLKELLLRPQDSDAGRDGAANRTDADDMFVHTAGQRVRVGLELCEAMLESQRDPRGAMRGLLRVRYDLSGLLLVDHATEDLVEQLLLDCAVRGGDLAGARALLGERTARQPRSPTAWAHLARVLHVSGRIHEAFYAQRHAHELGFGQGGSF